MSQQYINPYNLKNQSNFGQNSAPVMQGQTVATAGTNQLANRVHASKDANPLTTLALTLGLGYGIGQGMDYFNDKCGGEYSKSFFGKLGGYGDRFSKNTKVGRFIEKTYRKFRIWTRKKEKTSKFAYWLNHHSTSPSKGMPWDFARLPFHGLYGFWSMDAKQVMEHYIAPISEKPTRILMLFPGEKINDFNRLLEVGMTKDEIKAFEKSLKGKPLHVQAVELQWKELEKLGVDVRNMGSKTLAEMQQMAKEIKIKKTFGVSIETFNKIIEDPLANKREFLKLWEHAAKHNNIKVRVNHYNNTLWGRIKAHFTGRYPSFSEYYNKGLVALGKGNKTFLGRMMSKGFGYLVEGSTNRFAGGKLAPFMQATILADVLYHTFAAPKGEHTKTFMDRSVHDFVSFVGMIPALIGLHKLGGLKYLGASNADKEAYRQALKIHNENVKAGVFGSKKAFNASLKKVNSYLKRDNLNFIEKGLAKLGEFINCGNEHSFAYRSHARINMNFLRKIANTNLIGVPLRIWAIAMVASPFIAKCAVKATHAIFGKPTVSVLDEDTQQDEASQNPPFQGQSPQNQQVEGQQQYQTQPQTPQNTNNPYDTNLIRQTTGSHNNPYPHIETFKNDPTIPSQMNYNNDNNINNETELEPVRTYIPSPVGMVQNYDPTAAEIALNRADMSEKAIQNILGKLK